MAIEKKAKKSAKILRSKILVISKPFFFLEMWRFYFFWKFSKSSLDHVASAFFFKIEKWRNYFATK